MYEGRLLELKNKKMDIHWGIGLSLISYENLSQSKAII